MGARQRDLPAVAHDRTALTHRPADDQQAIHIDVRCILQVDDVVHAVAGGFELQAVQTPVRGSKAHQCGFNSGRRDPGQQAPIGGRETPVREGRRRTDGDDCPRGFHGQPEITDEPRTGFQDDFVPGLGGIQSGLEVHAGVDIQSGSMGLRYTGNE